MTRVCFAGLAMASFLAGPLLAAELPGFTKGTPVVKTISALAFHPQGILFIGDPTSQMIFAVDTEDRTPGGSGDVNVDKLDDKIGGLLGVTSKDVRIIDVRVNPASGSVYIAASRASDPSPIIVKLRRDGALAEFPLKDVSFAAVKLTNATNSQREPTGAITNMAFVDGKLLVAGLSSEEFASTLRVIPFPFSEADRGAGIEIFHGAHGRIETHAPIRTFVPYKVSGVDYILAAYTCTPLVRIPLADLKPGAKVRGATIAELGNGNRPLDMVVYTKEGRNYLLLANNKRGVMKIPADGVDKAPAITERPKTTTAGIKYETLSDLKDVTHLDALDSGRALLVIAPASGGVSLKTIPMP